MGGIGNSVVAFYAADHGIEAVMVMDTPASITETELANGAVYEVTVIDSSDPSCSADNYCISSIGSYKNTKRAIQAYY